MPSSTTNVAWTIPSTASKVSDLTKQSRDIPEPGPKQILVQLTAASLNFRDVLIATRSPYYPGDHKADLIPGCDGAGIIHSTGSSSTWAKKQGTKVLLHCNNWITGEVGNLSFETILGGTGTDGTLQQWIVVNDEGVVEAPSGLSAVESAAMVTAGTTAWSAIRGGMDLRLDGFMGEWPTSWTEKRLAGKTVLTMGTGGVSCFAIQVCFTHLSIDGLLNVSYQRSHLP
jgi:NADPH:quinone reductase-like Zn-dependent oxidoreductase